MTTPFRDPDHELLRCIREGRYRYERVHVEADLTYLRNLLDAHEPATEPEGPRIEDVLAGHAYKGLGQSPGIALICACGLMQYGAGMDSTPTTEVWRAHVAQAIREAGAV